MAVYGWISEAVEYVPNKYRPLVLFLSPSPSGVWTAPTIVGGIPQTAMIFIGMSDLAASQLVELDALAVTWDVEWAAFDFSGPNDQHTLSPTVRSKINKQLRKYGIDDISPGDGVAEIMSRLAQLLDSGHDVSTLWGRMQDKLGL